MPALTIYPGAYGTASKASIAALLGAASRCIANAPQQTRAAPRGSPSKAPALPTRQGRSISAPALFRVPVVADLEQLRTAHNVKQRKAVNISGVAVDGAHGAGGCELQQLDLALCARHCFQALLDHLLCPGGFRSHHRENLRFATLAGVDLARPMRMAICDVSNNLVGRVNQNISCRAFAPPFAGEVVVHLWSFLTTRADHTDGVVASYKAEAIQLSSGMLSRGVDSAEHGAEAACQYIKYACSGRVADAVRMHSFFASLTRWNRSRRASLFFVPLTPARSIAYRLAGRISASIGSGGAVLAGTGQNLSQNPQLIEITAYSHAVLWFRVSASRYARRHAPMRTCAYMCARNPRTSEPTDYFYILELVIGSKLGSARFRPEPEYQADGVNGGFLRFSIKIVGGYGAQWASSSWLAGWAGESFGVFALGGALRGLELVDLADLGVDDGFLRVCGRPMMHVGMMMLERWAESRANALFSGNRPLPIGKARTIAQVHQGTPPMPPFASALTSCATAAQTGQIWNGFSSLNHIGTMRCRQGGARRNGWSQIGSGKGGAIRSNPVGAGLGRQFAAEKLHRIDQAIGGRADVN